MWVNDEMLPSNVKERSIIDNENYVVVSEESVMDEVANFMAKCVLSNPSAQVMGYYHTDVAEFLYRKTLRLVNWLIITIKTSVKHAVPSHRQFRKVAALYHGADPDWL